jgi:hypothetical protein
MPTWSLVNNAGIAGFGGPHVINLVPGGNY